MADTVGVKNPYRYRGYRYDDETQLYYLQSRYYNPSWGRFINADGIIGQTGELLAHNLFAYCVNNIINLEDPSGFRPVYAGEETDRMREDSFAAMAAATKSVELSSRTVDSGTSNFNYKKSTIKGTASGAIDKVGEVFSGIVIKERKVWQSLETLTLGKYVSNLSKGAKFAKGAMGLLGTIGFTAWDTHESIRNGEYVGAGIDLLSAGAGFGGGCLIGIAGGAAITAGAPALLIGAVGFGGSVAAGVYIDKVSSGIKDKYYRR